MKYETIVEISKCNTIEECQMKCALLGDSCDMEKCERILKMDNWEKTLWLYYEDCNNRGVRDILF